MLMRREPRNGLFISSPIRRGRRLRPLSRLLREGDSRYCLPPRHRLTAAGIIASLRLGLCGLPSLSRRCAGSANAPLAVTDAPEQNRLKERCRLFRSLGNPSRHTWRHRISTGDIAGARGAEPEKTPRPFPRTCRNAWPEDSVASRRDSSWNPRRSCPRLRSYSHTPRQPCPLAG